MAREAVVCLLLQLISLAVSEYVTFPSGDKFSVVSQSSVPQPNEYTDVKNTGSVLVDSEETPSTLERRLGKNVPVSRYMSSGFRYVRAHPTFMSCLQKVIMDLLQQKIQVNIDQGFKPSSQSSGSEFDQYLQSGCGAKLSIKSTSGTPEDIAASVFKFCPVIVESNQRDVVAILADDSVSFYMAGPGSSGHVLTDQRSSAMSDTGSWVDARINEGIEPKANIDCSNYKGLTSGQHHPANRTHDRVLGLIDVKITRDMPEFKKLAQYQGTNIAFEDSESGASWCGRSNITCPACSDRIQGNDVTQRCADRVMTVRLRTALNKLQLKVRVSLSDKLLVKEAWDEAYDGHPDGDTTTDLLHYEGRAAKLALVSGDSSKLTTLSQLAVCSGADYVEHRGDYLYVAVKRQLPGGSKFTFPHLELLEVEPPVADESMYKLPSVFSESDTRQYPLFDSSGKLEATLTTNVTLGQFVSKDYRYFRLSPKLVACYSDVLNQLNKRNQPGDPFTELQVIRGFMSNKENKNKFDVVNDKRVNTHNLGVAMQIKFKNPTPEQTPQKLFYTVLDKCAGRFYQTRQEMGIGLYSDSVYVGIRSKFHLMKESLNHLPNDVTADDIEDRYLLARGGKVVDPENLESACRFQTAPKPQSYDFVHEHSEIVKSKRRRRSVSGTNTTSACNPTRYTKFCSETLKHREAVIADITSQLDRKHYPVKSRADIMEALKGCFGDCGTCLDGEIYESKTEHCNNFLHWVDFTLLNTAPDTTNFFLRSNRAATKHACDDNGADCIENSPLFSLVAPSVEKIYRPDPQRSVENQLYSAANNPLPVMILLEDIYAIQASGVVRFWVKDDIEMTSLKRQLEVVMLYNKNVTRIEVFVERYRIARDSVKGVIETFARTMATQGCPAVSRETLTPYEIFEVPTDKKKRAAEPDSVRYQVRDYHKNFEARWGAQRILV